MKKIEVTCFLEDADFIIKNLITKEDQENKKMIVTLPVEIKDDEDNYDFLCKNPDIIKWSFVKEIEEVKEKKDNNESIVEVEKELDSPISITSFSNYVHFFYAIHHISTTKPSLIPFTRTWMNEFLCFDSNNISFNLDIIKALENQYSSYKALILEDIKDLGKKIREKVIENQGNILSTINSITEYLMI